MFKRLMDLSQHVINVFLSLSIKIFSRILIPNLSVQTVMLLLRFSGVPRMSYILRVTPPAATKRLAFEFDLIDKVDKHK